MNIAKSDLSCENFLMVCRFWTDGRSNRFGIRLNSSGYLFEKKKIVICSNGLGYLFEKKCHLFEWFVLSVRTAWAIRLKKIVIHLNKIVICSNCYVNLFKKEIVDCSSNWSYLLEDKF